ncbi:MAG: RNA-binding cell elongation regulator Jag/EloR [Christensenellales bacterium]
MSAYESTGRTVEEAVNAGLERLKLSIGEVQVDILDEGSKGLFGLFGSKLARVRLTIKEEEESDTRSVFADSLKDYSSKAENRYEDKPAAVQKPEPRPPRIPAAPKPAPARPAPAILMDEQEEAPRAVRPPRQPARRAPLPVAEAAQPAATPAEAPLAPPPPAKQLDPQTMEGKVQVFLQELTRLMGVQVSVEVHSDEEGNIRANMMGDALGILIGRRGETLDALQYLTGLHLNKGQETYTRVTLDSEGYRAKREDALIRLANRMASRAVKTGRRVTMEPMNPYERRILHSALQNHPGIATHSEGEEPNRHVVITLAKEAGLPSEDEA